MPRNPKVAELPRVSPRHESQADQHDQVPLRQRPVSHPSN